MSKGFASSRRMGLLGVLLLLCYAALGVRLVWLHGIDREALLKPHRQGRPMLTPEAARRGVLLPPRRSRPPPTRCHVLLVDDPPSRVTPRGESLQNSAK